MELVAIAALCNAEDDYCRTDASLLWLLLLILLLPPLVLAEREREREQESALGKKRATACMEGTVGSPHGWMYLTFRWFKTSKNYLKAADL